MKKCLLGITLILLLMLTIGCKKNDKSVIGKWKSYESDNEYYYLFNKDKTCSYEMTVARLDCTYEDDGENITILFKGNEKPNVYQYRFDGNKLIIIDSAGKDNKFTKIN